MRAASGPKHDRGRTRKRAKHNATRAGGRELALDGIITYIPLLAEYGLQNIRARLARVSALGRVGIYE